MLCQRLLLGQCRLAHVQLTTTRFHHQVPHKDNVYVAIQRVKRFSAPRRLALVFSSSRFCMSARLRLSSAARSSSTSSSSSSSSSSCLARSSSIAFFIGFLALRVQLAAWSRFHCILSVSDDSAFDATVLSVAAALILMSGCPSVHPLRCSATVS